MSDEIQHIISRESKTGQGIVIKTITDYLARCQEASGMAKTDKHFKIKETKKLIDFIETEKLLAEERIFNFILLLSAFWITIP